MSQHSEERVPDSVVPMPTNARVVPFERPQSELQRAVQQRAQEAIELERERAASRRPPAWRRGLVLALATIPVFITFGAAIGFVGALRQFNTAMFNAAPTAPAGNTGQTSSEAGTAQQPGVVMLQPLSSSSSTSKPNEIAPAAPAGR